MNLFKITILLFILATQYCMLNAQSTSEQDKSELIELRKASYLEKNENKPIVKAKKNCNADFKTYSIAKESKIATAKEVRAVKRKTIVGKLEYLKSLPKEENILLKISFLEKYLAEIDNLD